MKTVRAYKAQPLGSSTPEAVTILIKDELPTTLDDETSVEAMDVDARRIVDALFESLPGGTLDRVCADLLRRRASSLCVARRVTTP